jgi:isoquinoline 1-oxidoreductase subunit beta
MAPKIDAWVVIKPDDAIVVCIARSETGQGKLTVLALLVAGKFDADWSKAATNLPASSQNRDGDRAA